jgi:hypothetical protein
MKVRAGKLILWALVALVAVVSVPVAWVIYRFLYPASGAAPAVKIATLLHSNDPHRMLSEANRYYWTHHLPAASPVYEKAEKLLEQSRDDRDALYARIGPLRSLLPHQSQRELHLARVARSTRSLAGDGLHRVSDNPEAGAAGVSIG